MLTEPAGAGVQLLGGRSWRQFCKDRLKAELHRRASCKIAVTQELSGRVTGRCRDCD